MRLTVVGCSGSMAGPDSAASCYLIQAEDPLGRTWNVVLDLGSGAFGSLQRFVDPALIDAVCLSHLHADHCADLVGLAVWARYGPGGPLPPIPVFGPRATADRIGQLTDHGRGERVASQLASRGAAGSFDVRAWAPGRVARIGPFEISPYPAEHPVEAYALTVAAPSDRDDATATLTYTGDGDLGPGVSTAAEGVSLLLAEAGFLEGRDQVAGVHMTACQAGLLAAEAGVGELVLTHIAPWDNPEGAVRAARRVYGGPVRAARPGAVHRV